MEYINSFSLKFESYERILGLLSRNNAMVNNVSRFQVAVKQLIINQKKLEALLSLSGNDISVFEEVKNECRGHLEESVIIVIRILQVFAHDRQKRNLQREIYHLTPEFVENSLDIELIKISKKIWLILNKYGEYSPTFINRVKALLKPDDSKDVVKFEKEYGLSHEMVRKFEKTMIRFIENMLLFEDEMKKKEKVEIKIKKINKKTKKLLANKIDRFVLLFENENPGFYDEYRQLRENQMATRLKESLAQESDPVSESTEEVRLKKVRKKTTTQKSHKSNSKRKEDL